LTVPHNFSPTLYMPLVCIVLQGTKQAVLGDAIITFGATQSLIVSIDLPTSSRVTQASPETPYVALALELDFALLRELALLTDSVADASITGNAVAAGPSQMALLDAFERLFALIGQDVASKVLAPLIIREIHFLMLTAGHGVMLRSLMSQDGHASRIALSIGVIKRDFHLPLRVADLARLAGMSVSGFHDHFKTVTGTSPLQFQKQLRLITARQLLRVDSLSVTQAAFAVGYESPTQFSRDFRRNFGASPSREGV
jgi:AraC-like DNA-binding protein